eukprot:COSAG05_NODE_2332_length_3219_cov_8.397436_3_plen_72_part_00
MPRESSFRKVEKFGLVLVRFPPLLLARSERFPPAASARISRLRAVHAKWPRDVFSYPSQSVVNNMRGTSTS